MKYKVRSSKIMRKLPAGKRRFINSGREIIKRAIKLKTYKGRFKTEESRKRSTMIMETNLKYLLKQIKEEYESNFLLMQQTGIIPERDRVLYCNYEKQLDEAEVAIRKLLHTYVEDPMPQCGTKTCRGCEKDCFLKNN